MKITITTFTSVMVGTVVACIINDNVTGLDACLSIFVCILFFSWIDHKIFGTPKKKVRVLSVEFVKKMIEDSFKNGRVVPYLTCPNCKENRPDMLIWKYKSDVVECKTCQHQYKP